MKTPLLALLFIARTSSAALVYDIKVEFRNDAPGEKFRDSNGALLYGGSPSIFADGTQLQYGYFSLATHVNPFLGAFVPLTGERSHNGYLSTVGDGPGPQAAGKPPGQFWIGTIFAFEDNFIGNDLPVEGTPMALRFFDGTTIANSTHFNTVANALDVWDWHTGPRGNHAFIDLSNPGAVWEGGATSAFRTTLPVPEPSTATLMITAMIGAGRKRRPRSVRSRFNRVNPAVSASTQRHGFANHCR